MGEVCQVDLFVPGPEVGSQHVLFYRGECWYWGSCIMVCLVEGEIKLRHPLMNMIRWAEKDNLEQDNPKKMVTFERTKGG